MIFNEIYGAYYNAVSKIVKCSVENNFSRKEMRGLIEKYAFSESFLTIEFALSSEKWQLIKSDGTTPIKHIPSMPLTNLQKRWLKAISLDSRIKLFDCNFDYLDDVEPLFTPEDYYIFDKYSDGDNYDDPEYISNFKKILGAVKTKQPLIIKMTNRKGRVTEAAVIPKHLEYSEKDDKFRLITAGNRIVKIINLGRIVSCEYFYGNVCDREENDFADECCVTLIIKDNRNTPERAMIHFSHFKKEVEKLDEKSYKMKINYSRKDETELVIRILSFGPTVRVLEPEHFLELIRERLRKQKNCGLF